MDTYPTEREVRKIIDSNMPFFGGYVSFLEGNDVKCHAATVFLGGWRMFFNF